MLDILTLVKRTPRGDADESTRTVFCGVRSIGQQEFYQASATDFHPELKLVLADYLDYNNETLVDYNGQRYRVLRTYRTGQELELTLERAPDEDGEADG
jgi:SPP1 family predicted phage head-tail adaptor